MKRFRGALGAMVAAVLLVACGGTNTESAPVNQSTTHGTLVFNPPCALLPGCDRLPGATRQQHLRGSSCCSSQVIQPVVSISTISSSGRSAAPTRRPSPPAL